MLAGNQWRGKKAQNFLLSSGGGEPGPAVLGIVGVEENNRPGSGRFEARAVSGVVLFIVDAQRAVVGVNGGVGSTAQVDGQAGAIGTVASCAISTTRCSSVSKSSSSETVRPTLTSN